MKPGKSKVNCTPPERMPVGFGIAPESIGSLKIMLFAQSLIPGRFIAAAINCSNNFLPACYKKL